MLRPPRKSVPTETRHPVQKNAVILPKMCSPELGKKSKKRKNNPIEHYIKFFIPLPRRPSWADLYHF